MPNEIIKQKSAVIAYCVARIQQEYSEKQVLENSTQREAILLNIQRACKSIVELGLHILRIKKLGTPENFSDIFLKLETASIIPEQLSLRLQNLINFCHHHLSDLNEKESEMLEKIINQQIYSFVLFINFIGKLG